jgi:hypothetical protein
VTFGWRASEADDAVQVDIYLESLLAAHDRSPAPIADLGEAEGLDPAERRAAQLLVDHLLRFHPSFRFEEALAGRLRAVAERSGPAGRAATAVLPFPGPAEDAHLLVDASADGSDVEVVAEHERLAAVERRRVLIGGAIASGVSLAGAAFVAWRASTPPRSAFGRATRAAHRNRPSMRGRD